MFNNLNNIASNTLEMSDVEFVDYTFKIEIISSDNVDIISKWFKNDITKTLPEVIKEFIKECSSVNMHSLKSVYLTKFSRFKKERKRKCL